MCIRDRRTAVLSTHGQQMHQPIWAVKDQVATVEAGNAAEDGKRILFRRSPGALGGHIDRANTPLGIRKGIGHCGIRRFCIELFLLLTNGKGQVIELGFGIHLCDGAARTVFYISDRADFIHIVHDLDFFLIVDVDVYKRQGNQQ